MGSDLRTLARTLFDAGVRAANPGKAVERALALKPLPNLQGGKHILIAVGKAATAMLEAAVPFVPPGKEFAAIAITNYENHREIPGCTVLAAGHPIPDENGLRAGQLIIHQLLSAGVNDRVLFLISGGGSALLPAPLPGVSLADKAKTNDILLANGFGITQINLVRQQLSLLKGGGLARLAEPAKVRTLAVSDVIGDDPRTIASGPTAAPLGTALDAIRVLKERDVWLKLPGDIRKVLNSVVPASRASRENADISVICANRVSLEAIARAAPSWSPQIVSARLCEDVNAAAQKIAKFIELKPLGKKRLLIWGGETTVNVTGSGKGGRNQELALRLALAADHIPGDWVFLSGGTDGRDGPTDAAGGIVDPSTNARISATGMNNRQQLDNNDSYDALKSVGDLLITGPTGTNVADIQLFLRSA